MPPDGKKRARPWKKPGNTVTNAIATSDSAIPFPAQPSVRKQVCKALVEAQPRREEQLREKLLRQKRHAQWLAKAFAETGHWKHFRALVVHVRGMCDEPKVFLNLIIQRRSDARKLRTTESGANDRKP